MKAERTEGGRFEAHRLAARRDACRYKDGFRNPSVGCQGAFKRNITAGDEALSDGKGMDGIAAISLAEDVSATLQTNERSISQGAVDHAITARITAAEKFAELALAEDAIRSEENTSELQSLMRSSYA